MFRQGWYAVRRMEYGYSGAGRPDEIWPTNACGAYLPRRSIPHATVISLFPENERGKALGTHLSVIGAGAIAGPALGGLLISYFGWRSVFFVNVPVGLITIAVSYLILTGDRPSIIKPVSSRE